MKKSLLAVAMLVLLSSKQILACDYYENERVLKEMLDTGTYKSNATGKVCSYGKRSVIRIKKGKVNGKAKVFLPNNQIITEAKFKNGKLEGLAKDYYESGALRSEINFKNGLPEGLEKRYDESGKLEQEVNYKNGRREGLFK